MKSEVPEGAPSTGWSWKAMFAIDPRSLAVFRIGLGLLLLVDLAVRASDLGAMYTDDGMFSRAEICRRYSSIWNWSFHLGSGSETGQAVLFGLAGLLAVALVAGWETRIATIGSWLMLVSIHHRAPPVLSGADLLLRMLLFWGMFLPLGRVWSLDSKREKTLDLKPVWSVATAAVLLQMGMMYFFSGVFKSNASWLNGEALKGSLSHDFFASSWAGTMLAAPPGLLKLIGWGTLFLELAGPFLLFASTRLVSLRMALLAGLAAMHVGIAVLLKVDLFSWVSLSGLMLFVPTAFWNRILKSEVAIESSEPGGSLSFGARVAQGVCAAAFVYVVALNINTLPKQPLRALGLENCRPLYLGLALGQKWGMFDTAPSNDGWYVARAKLNDGTEVDLLRGGAAVSWQRPENPPDTYPTFRWRKLFREMSYFDEQGYQVFRGPAAAFLCRSWNAGKAREQQVAEFDFVFCRETDSKLVSLLRPAVTREPLWHLEMNGSY